MKNNNLGRRITHKHPDAINDEGVYECKLCSFVCVYPSNYSAHLLAKSHINKSNVYLLNKLQDKQ